MTTGVTAILLTALLLLPGCSGGQEETAPPGAVSNALEEELFVIFDDQRVAEYRYLVASCAQFNGVDGWVEEPHVGDDIVNFAGDVAESGSGLIIGFIEGRAAAESMEQDPDHMEPEDPVLERVLDIGPVTAPDGSHVGYGCRGWASAEIETSGEVVALRETGKLYHDYVMERLEVHPEIVELERDWSTCMAEQGYGGLASRGDQLDQIFEMRDRLISGEVDEATALAFDIAITTAAKACEGDQTRRLQIRDEIAEQFIADFDFQVG